MARVSNGTPEKTRGENAATVLGRAVTQRVHAIVGQVFDELEKRAKGGKRDIVALIADYLEQEPMTGLERLAKLLPQEPVAPAGPVNIQAMFLQAVKQVNSRDGNDARVIEATARPAIDNASDDEW
jgi:hypothetical protein